MYYGKIYGWFTFDRFYDSVLKRFPDNSHFVEIGCFVGKSTCYMAERIKELSRKIKFDCVDTWMGSQNEPAHLKFIEEHGDLYTQFTDNLNKADVIELINPIKMTSHDASLLYPNNSIDFVFIDADHMNLYQDLVDWFPKVKNNGGLIAGHDSDYPKIIEDLNKFFNKSYKGFVGEVWYYDKFEVNNHQYEGYSGL